MTPLSDPPPSLRSELRLIHPAAWLAAGFLLLFWYGLLMPFFMNEVQDARDRCLRWILRRHLAAAGLLHQRGRGSARDGTDSPHSSGGGGSFHGVRGVRDGAQAGEPPVSRLRS